MEGHGHSRGPIGVAVFACAAVVLGGLAMADVGFRDAGEIGTAGFELGVAHPTGFVLDMVWLRLSAFLPFGHLAFRQNLFTALVAAAALGVLAQLAFDVASRIGAAVGAVVGAWVAAAGLGTWATFFTAARAVEVYASGLLALLFACLWLLRRPRDPGVPLLLIGLSPGLHITAGLYMAVLLLGRTLAVGGAFGALRKRLPIVLLGAGVISYLPLASRRQPALDWGDPETPAALFAHLTAARIRDAYAGEMLDTGGHAGLQVVAQLGQLWPLLPLTLVALLATWRRARGIALAGLALFVADLAYAVWVNPMGAIDRQVGHVAGAMLALAAGIGAAVLFSWAYARVSTRLAVHALAVCVVAAVAWRFDGASARDGYAAGELYGSGGPLGHVGPRALIICATDDACAAGLFALHAEGARPDLEVVPAQHLWDPTVLRRLEGFDALKQPGDGGGASAAARLRGELANARVERLATGQWPRPVLWESALPLAPLRDAIVVSAAALPPYLEAHTPTHAAAWPAGVVARLDRMRLARLPRGLPTEAWTQHAWSSAYSAVGEHALMTDGTMEGIGALRTATQLSPGRAVAWSNLGVALETVADLPGAIDATREAIRLEPARPTAWANLARLQLKRGDASAAQRVLDLAAGAGVRDPRLDALRAQLAAPN